MFIKRSAKVNAYILHIFGKIWLLIIHAIINYFKMFCLNDFQEAKKYLYIGHWKYGRNMIMVDVVSDRTFETIA